MSKKFCGLMAGLAAMVVATVADAAAITVTRQVRRTSAAEAGDPQGGAPANGVVGSFFVTTDADILSIDQVLVELNNGGTLFNVPAPFGANNAKPDPAFIALRPALGADSWIDTPGAGAASQLGSDIPGDGSGLWGDTSDDGAQTNFGFAQFTMAPGVKGKFNFRISIADPTNTQTGVFSQTFSLNVPEPATFVMGGIGLLGMLAVRRRFA